MAKGKIIGKVARKAGTLVYVDAQGNVRETAPNRGGTKGRKVCHKAAPKKKTATKKKAAPKKKAATKKKAAPRKKAVSKKRATVKKK